ncbi:uncharacterized protein LOC124606529 [Schistocerca americana]|uniref:uncharacterized protein LOC124606529 n=1 Tax=Schistocerca americana TaxID=7009 RepID=UPI001F4F31B0|nr:uncharacterized protein LOC124606529 [Schistocerca americana]
MAAGVDEVPVSIITRTAVQIEKPLAHIASLSFSEGVFLQRRKISKDRHKKENYRPISLLPDSSIGKSDSLDIYNISSKILKLSSHNIAEVLCHIINYCFDESCFPEKLKVAKVIPVHKKDSHQLLSNSQFGFRKNLSTCDAVMSYICNCLEAKEEKYIVSTKFDTVCHNTLLMKLKTVGFSVSAVKIIQSYLPNRSQTVYFNNQYSSFLPVNHGVPKG